jgi:hypothetical protein
MLNAYRFVSFPSFQEGLESPEKSAAQIYEKT